MTDDLREAFINRAERCPFDATKSVLDCAQDEAHRKASESDVEGQNRLALQKDAMPEGYCIACWYRRLLIEMQDALDALALVYLRHRGLADALDEIAP